jgi:hypothetical protein
MDQPTEAQLWANQSTIATAALNFAITFLGCRMGSNNQDPLDANAVQRLLTIFRAVSYVESVHGTQGDPSNQPARDPLQSGNPGDSWWQELTGQSGQGDRFVRGGDLASLWSNQLVPAVEQDSAFPTLAFMLVLSDKTAGHNDQYFTPYHSYCWGVFYLLHRINTTAGDPAYGCGDLSDDRLISGAVAYNGQGISDYEQKIRDALTLIGGFPQPRQNVS